MTQASTPSTQGFGEEATRPEHVDVLIVGAGISGIGAACRITTESPGRSFAVLAGLEWKRLMEAFDAARAALPEDSWLELRYEDVTADPGPAFERLLNHAGLGRTPEFQRALASFQFTRSRADAYRSELGSRDLELLDEALAPQLAQYGY